MSVTSLRSTTSEAYVVAFSSATFSGATNITLFTAPAACKRVEWELVINQTGGLLDNANFVEANLYVGTTASDGLSSQASAGGGVLTTRLTNAGYASATEGSGAVGQVNQVLPPVIGSIPPGASLFMRARVSGNPGTLRFAIQTRTYL